MLCRVYTLKNRIMDWYLMYKNVIIMYIRYNIYIMLGKLGILERNIVNYENESFRNAAQLWRVYSRGTE